MGAPHGNSNDHHSHGPTPPPEPKTPMWLPALGAVLFLTVGLLWALSPNAEDSPHQLGGAAPAAGTAKP